MKILMGTCDHVLYHLNTRSLVRAAGVLAAVTAFMLSFMLSCAGEEGNKMTTLAARAVPGEVLGWKASDTTETYDRESIFDYIDGAGEVYRSYDFREVTVWRFTRPAGPDITVEIFDMGTPDDAYGVFSYARESEESGIGGGFEQRGGVICFWQNRYYVCVAADETTEDSRAAVMALARTIAERLPSLGAVPHLVRLMPREGMVEHTERFFHIHPSLNYHYFLAEQNVLNLSENTDAVLAAYQPGTTYLLCIEYPSAPEAREAHGGFIDNYLPEAAETGATKVAADKWVSALTLDRYVIVVLDAVSHERATALVNSMKKSLVEAKMVTEDQL